MKEKGNILVFGASGQVGSALQAYRGVRALSRDHVNLLQPKACYDVIQTNSPSAVINASAYTAVDHAELEEEQATVINGHSPAAMARSCRELGIPFLHISTDYVFGGAGKDPYTETDAVAPINAYGRTKLLGEQGVQSSGCQYAILRTSWVFSPRGTNFVRTMLRLSQTRDELNIVQDQIGGPTPASGIASALMTMVSQLQQGASSGIYHFAGAPAVSWFDFATQIFRQAQIDMKLTPVLSEDFPTEAKRPMNSRLDCSRIEAEFGIQQPDWKAEVEQVINEFRNNP